MSSAVWFGYVGILIAEEIGLNLSATPFLSTAILGVTALLKAVRRHTRKRCCRVAAGDVLVALAADSVRDMRRSARKRATSSAGKFKLNGKLHVLDGHVADRLIVGADVRRCRSAMESLFLVDPKHLASLSRMSVSMVATSCRAARVRFLRGHSRYGRQRRRNPNRARCGPILAAELLSLSAGRSSERSDICANEINSA
jgi:hypothetical protein